jgi:DNA-binding transcriptional LysR family regulator
MDRFSSMLAFTTVVESGGFTAAAEKLGLSRAALSKSVQQLEAHLGARLLHRTTRRIGLTETGKAYFERARDILHDVEEIECLASEQTTRPQGLLRINAPTSFGIRYLCETITRYRERYPDVQLSLSFSDRFVDVVEEGYDVVIRIADLTDSSLIARKIAPCRRVFVASPDYLKRHVEPNVPQDLALHPCLIYADHPRADTWQLRGPNGMESVKVNGPVHADSGDFLCAAAMAGQGITVLPTFIVGPEIRAGRLKQILLPYSITEIAIYALFPSRRYLSAKVRTFVDFLADCYGECPEWDDF